MNKQDLMNIKAKQGFTLIELLISISILSLLLLTGSYSYNLMSTRWQKELGGFTESVKQGKHLELLQQVLVGAKAFIVTDNKAKPAFFFIGKQDSLLAVTSDGLFSGQYPEIFRITSVEKNNGLFDLVYQSASTQNILLSSTEQIVSFTNKIVLFNDLDNISLAYYGWSHYSEKTKSADGDGEAVRQPQWFESFSGINNQIMPEKMIITLTKKDKLLSFPVQLDHDSLRLLSPYFEMVE